MTLVRIAAVIVFVAGLQADGAAATRSDDVLRTVRAVLATPENKIDFARAKLALDKLVDPAVDIDAALKQLDVMTATIRTMAGSSANALERLRAVRMYIYVSGPWNGQRPYGYDLRDPFGRIPEDRLLTHYLTARRGNCISMPVLFLILADRVGVHVTLAQAPNHVFVRYVDDATGRTYNLETTSGAYPARDEWYREQMPMTDKAVADGVYLKTLSRREDLALMSATVLQFELENKRYESAIVVADAILERFPNFAVGLVSKGMAYVGLIDERFRSRYRTPADIPAALRPEFLSLQRNADAAFDRVEALGAYDVGAKAKQPVSTNSKSGGGHA